MYDVVIVGAGIAGLTAAIYVRRAGKSVLVLEGEAYGGQIINTLEIENWPGDYRVSGVDLMQKVYKQAIELGVEVEFERVEAVVETDEYLTEKDAANGARKMWLVQTEDDEYKARSVILAVGAKNRKLGLSREDELTGRGVSFCATCDGAFYKNKDVAVIGGGNTALDDALYLSAICRKVFLVHRRDEFRGDKATVEKLQGRNNVEFVLGYVPEEIIGDEKVIGLRLVPSGKVREVSVEKELEVAGVFVAIGQEPETRTFAELVDLDKNGYIMADEGCKTSRPGILVAGDCRTKTVRQLVTAAADGAMAADVAIDYLA